MMSHSWQYPASTASIASARNAVAAAVSEDGHPALAEDARLLTSELATNAVVHAASGFGVRALVDERIVRLEVVDRSPVMPVRRHPAPDDPSGRGYHIVDALSAHWGIESAPPGKMIWVELAEN